MNKLTLATVIAALISQAAGCVVHATDRDHGGGGGGEGGGAVVSDAMAGDRSLGVATLLTNEVIQGQNRVTDLGVISIPIDGL